MASTEKCNKRGINSLHWGPAHERLLQVGIEDGDCPWRWVEEKRVAVEGREWAERERWRGY